MRSHVVLFTLTLTLLLISGCSTMGVDKDSIAVVTKEYGQCLANTKTLPKYKKREVSFRCQDNFVLLGSVYTKKGNDYIRSARLIEKEGMYTFKKRKSAHVVKGLHSICQLQPIQGKGDLSIRRYYFDIPTKACKPFLWKGDGGFVPFKNQDACEQYCGYRYQG